MSKKSVHKNTHRNHPGKDKSLSGFLLAPYGGGYAKNPDKEQLEQLPVQSSPGFLVADGLLGMFI